MAPVVPKLHADVEIRESGQPMAMLIVPGQIAPRLVHGRAQDTETAPTGEAMTADLAGRR